MKSVPSLATLLTAACLLLGGRADARGAPQAASPARAVPAQEPEVFAGSTSCRECHERFYQLWAPSHHGLAMQPYTAELAAARLTPQAAEVPIGERSYQAQVGAQQGWMAERGPDGERRLPIEHVLGGKNVFYFLTPGERGRLQTLPLAYDVRRREWFDTAASGVRHFPGHSDEPLHWTDREYTFNTSCYSCHVSQLATNYDDSGDSYDTVWAEPGINCETCHGGGAEHVRVCREAAEGRAPQDLRIIRTKGLDQEATNAMCAPCHAKMVPLTTTFLPGERLLDHYDLTTLENLDFHSDGRDLGENYTLTGWRMSPCVKAGELDCLHCHTSSGRFRFADDPNGACLPCHAGRVAGVAEHARHPAGGDGGRCIDCHMPKTEFARMLRSDHSMLPPTPAATIRFGSPNACSLCHTDRDAAWADGLVREWHEHDYQAPVLQRAALVDAARRQDWALLDDMLGYVADPARDEIVATSLIRLLGACGDEAVAPVLLEALRDPSGLVRSAAAQVLGPRLTLDSLGALLAAAGDEVRLVRIRAAAALAGVPREVVPAEDRAALDAATAEFIVSMSARPDDAASRYNLGNFHLERREPELAIASFERAQQLDPRRIEPLVNASLAYNLTGRNDLAEASLRRALTIDPVSVAANLNLGMLLSELGRLDEAEVAFRAAWTADPQSARAAYNLALIVVGDRPDEAVALARKALELSPDEVRYAHVLAFCLIQAGRGDEAVSQLRLALGEHPSWVDGYLMLGQLLEELGRVDEAAELYRQAASEEQLPGAIRASFTARLRARGL